MSRTLSLQEFAVVFPQFADELLKELTYSMRQETAKDVLAHVRTASPVADPDTLSKGSISKAPGDLRRAWRTLRGSRSVRGRTRVVAGGVAAIANEPYRRLPKGGAVGSPRNAEGITKPAERVVAAKSGAIEARAVTRTETYLNRKFRT